MAAPASPRKRLGEQHCQNVLAQRLLQGPAKADAGLLVPLGDAALAVGQHDGVLRVLQHGVVGRVGLLQLVGAFGVGLGQLALVALFGLGALGFERDLHRHRTVAGLLAVCGLPRSDGLLGPFERLCAVAHIGMGLGQHFQQVAGHGVVFYRGRRVQRLLKIVQAGTGRAHAGWCGQLRMAGVDVGQHAQGVDLVQRVRLCRRQRRMRLG
jgi:hypothetical protein